MIYFVNENPNPANVGALSAHKNEITLLSEYEHWYVDVGHIVFDLDGFCYRMILQDGRLNLKRLNSTIYKSFVYTCMCSIITNNDDEYYPDKIAFIKNCNDYPVED